MSKEMKAQMTIGALDREIGALKTKSQREIQRLIYSDTPEGCRMRMVLTVTRYMQDRRKTLKDLTGVICWKVENTTQERIEIQRL